MAVSDPSAMIAGALATVDTPKIFDFFKEYIAKNQCCKIVVGYPLTLKNEPSEIVPEIDRFITRFKTLFPSIEVIKYDERFTSKLAFDAMLAGGLGKNKRRDKSIIDRVSATIILQNYLEECRNLRL